MHPLAGVLASFDVLSLDVFDTAILRRVARPVDVFALVAIDFHARRPEAKAFDFATARVNAERIAREHAAAGHRDEVTLDEIYAALDAPAEWRSELRALELETEHALCVAHPSVKELYLAARRRGMPVVFVSDMYLPRATLERILRDSGYEDHAGLFLSSELGLTKSGGELYAHVARAVGVPAHRILHLGDDYGSDVVQARRQGFVAWHQPRPARSPADDLFSSVRTALVRERRHAGGDDFWARVGYELAGPLFLGFVSWVRDRAIAEGCDRVYFLARDGFILHQVYQRLDDGPPASYLYASRRALNFPAIVTLGDTELDFLTSGYTPLRVRDFLGRIGLDAADHAAEVRAAGFSSAEERVPVEQRARLRDLFRRLEPLILARTRDERALATEYLWEQGLSSARKVAIVDLGWHGTLQRSLSKLLAEAGAKTEPVGLYLATYEAARAVAAEGHELHGWLANFGTPSRWNAAIRACCEIWEFVHSAPHGSVLRFARGPSGIEPVLAAHEAPAEQRAAAETVQHAGLAFVDDALAVMRGRALPITADAAASPLERLVLTPTPEEAVRFGDLHHAEGFGDALALRPLVAPPSLRARLGSPTTLRHEYDSAYWKEGYFARNPLARLLAR